MNQEAIFIHTVTWGVFVTIFFMSVALRAARAHKKLAKAVEEISHKS